ncbi:hypothetical protein PR048_020173 [Dryococelus australis]|uniref:Integrase catalytic domain-containing protein n=1 Tax=Dryococelus australis TaxID=614101 RepID=A0ABQ9H5N9_9NEOP|nr:hypothetical protein PR048_020173 [Dryococelus australis]
MKAFVLGHKVMSIQCDNGAKLNNENLQSFLKTKGNEIRYTMPYTPQQNGCADFPYREVVGLLMYLLICTKPYISYANNIASGTLENPSESDIIRAKQIYCHLNGKSELGIFYKKD